MTQPPPYGPAYPPAPRRKRPRAFWFVLGGVLVVLAPVVFVAALFLTLSPLARGDAEWEVGPEPHSVTLPAGEERALFTSPGYSADCTAVDGSGRQVRMRRMSAEFTFNEWTALYRFDTGDGDVTFECVGESYARIRIGQVPTTSEVVGGLLVGVLVPLALGGTGVLVLIITAVLWATGVPRDEPQAPGPG